MYNKFANYEGATAQLIYDSKMQDLVERYQNVEELLAGIKEFVVSRNEGESGTLSDFMLEVALLTDADEDKNEERNHVTLMTIHSIAGR